MQTIGGNIFERGISPTARVCRFFGLMGWGIGIGTMGTEAVQTLGVVIPVAGTAIFVTGAWLNYRYQLLDQLVYQWKKTKSNDVQELVHEIERVQQVEGINGAVCEVQVKPIEDSSRPLNLCKIQHVEKLVPMKSPVRGADLF